MEMYRLITKKKRGISLTEEEIKYIVSGFTNGSIPDYQMSAFLMAVCFNGMNDEEIYHLTMAMRDSGDVIDLSEINGIKVDKHSTGGVGDKISLILGPMVAALGVPVAKMSGRGLGHTGGTIDKLESIEGFSTKITRDEFVNNVNNIKIAIAGQTENLAPADKKIYALRDVTATVDSIPLIASSIMSKKLASGADAIVLDVKCGNGAFMKNEEDAIKLAKVMVDIGDKAGKNMTAIVTDMNQPLGFNVGNALEVIEAIDVLKGKKVNDLLEVCLELGAHMAVYGGVCADINEAKTKLSDTITSGKAIEKFKEFVRAQGGDETYIDDTSKFKLGNIIEEVYLESEGVSYIDEIITEDIGVAVLELGGGRKDKESIIDLSVGVVLHKKIGDIVEGKTNIATIYGNDKDKVEKAKNIIVNAYKLKGEASAKIDVIKKIIDISKKK
ncbi:MAG: pyrimidine-nucleoside phosphorylase [Lachnospiraceae bacterium]|nr:pyrimidine-nucleoside phosphorylase [Lachnospiraceae bacterium]